MDNQNQLKVNLIEEDNNNNKVKLVQVKPIKPINTITEYKPIQINNNQSDIPLNLTPIIFFINPKSGSKEGANILKLFPKEVNHIY